VREPLLRSVRATLATASRDAALPGILARYGGLRFLGPSPAVMLPTFALRVLHLWAAQMGFVSPAVGVGTNLGGLTVVSLGDFRYKGRLFLTALTIRSIALGMFAASTAVWPSAAALLVLGAAQNAAGAIPAGALIGAAGGPLTAGVSAALTGAYEVFLAVGRLGLRDA